MAARTDSRRDRDLVVGELGLRLAVGPLHLVELLLEFGDFGEGVLQFAVLEGYGNAAGKRCQQLLVVATEGADVTESVGGDD